MLKEVRKFSETYDLKQLNIRLALLKQFTAWPIFKRFAPSFVYIYCTIIDGGSQLCFKAFDIDARLVGVDDDSLLLDKDYD